MSKSRILIIHKLTNDKQKEKVEECLHDRFKMTEWIWSKFLKMTNKITPTNINLDLKFNKYYHNDKHKCVNMTEINIRRCEFFWSNSNRFLVIWNSFSWVFKRGLVLFFLNNFSRFLIFHISLSNCVILGWYTFAQGMKHSSVLPWQILYFR